jgi:hypothetical protein
MSALNTNTLIGILVVLGFILFFGWMIVWMARSTKQQKKERADMAAMLGFQPVLKPDYVTLKSRLAHINPKHVNNYIELRDVFIRHIPEGDLYLYDLWDTSGDSSNVIQDRALALVVTGKQFPRFVISTRLSMPGMLAQFANKVISWAVGYQMTIFDFPEEPDFNEHFVVAGEDELEVRNLLNSSILHRIKGHEWIFLAGGGDTLEYSPQFEKYTGKKDINYLSTRINSALDVMRLFIE